MSDAADIIVIGAGHDTLIAAAYPVRAGPVLASDELGRLDRSLHYVAPDPVTIV